MPSQVAPAASTRPSRCRSRTRRPQQARPALLQGLPIRTRSSAEARGAPGELRRFIKELMRRLAQASIARDGGNTVNSDDISEALDECCSPAASSTRNCWVAPRRWRRGDAPKWRACYGAHRKLDAFVSARLVVRPSRPSAERQRAHRTRTRRCGLLLDDFEISRRLAILHPVDQHAQHVDIRGRAGADMVDSRALCRAARTPRLGLAQLRSTFRNSGCRHRGSARSRPCVRA